MAEVFAAVLIAANLWPLGEAACLLVRQIIIFPDELTQREADVISLLGKASRQVQIQNSPRQQLQRIGSEIQEVCKSIGDLATEVRSSLPPEAGRFEKSWDKFKRIFTHREERQKLKELGEVLESKRADLNLAAALATHAQLTEALDQDRSLPQVLGQVLDTGSVFYVYWNNAGWQLLWLVPLIAVLAFGAHIFYTNGLDKLDLMTLLPISLRGWVKKHTDLDSVQAGVVVMWLLRCAMVAQLVLVRSWMSEDQRDGVAHMKEAFSSWF